MNSQTLSIIGSIFQIAVLFYCIRCYWKASRALMELQQEHMALYDRFLKARQALLQIADPRARPHREPDAYTELGCVMEIARKALEGK